MCNKHVGGSENLGYLDNTTKHFMFCLSNMKQLNFRHFNTNSKKFTVTVIFFQNKTKTRTAPNLTPTLFGF